MKDFYRQVISKRKRKILYNLDMKEIKVNDPKPGRQIKARKRENYLFCFLLLSNQSSLQVSPIGNLSVI